MSDSSWPRAPSEPSGSIVGGVNGRLRVDFDDNSLSVFTARWETPEGPLDPRFACFILPYKQMKDRLNSVRSDGGPT